MQFQWDENKAKQNIKNHDGINFDDAVEVFFDEFALDEYDAIIPIRKNKDLIASV